MSEYSIQDTTLSEIANAIRAKTGKNNAMTPLEMPSEIGSISGGGGSGEIIYFSLIPIMTSNTAPSGVASASAAAYDCQPWCCMNGSPGTAAWHRWSGAFQSGSTNYIQYRFSNSVYIDTLEIIPGGADVDIGDDCPCVIQASNDGTTFVDLGTFTILASQDKTKINIPVNCHDTKYSYVRLVFNSWLQHSGSNHIIGLHKFQVYTKTVRVTS